MGVMIITTADCASSFGIFKIPGSRPGTEYTVELHGETGVHCTCKAFQFSRDRNCKHIETIWNRATGACLWNPQWCDGIANPLIKPVSYTNEDIIPGETCPVCGGPVIAVKRAV